MNPCPRRLLFISYAFPPTGGGGVQRSVKFTKFLPDQGWLSTILTVENPSVPVQDSDFAMDLDPRNTIVSARTWEPSYQVKSSLTDQGRHGLGIRKALRNVAKQLLQPDPQVLWNFNAYHQATRALQTTKHDAILVTGPPFSSFLLGCKLKNKFKLPLILDFRDEWLLVGKYMENHRLSGRSLRKQQRMLHQSLRMADAVVATTEASAEELTATCRELGSTAKVTCIYNGYDPADCRVLSKTSPSHARCNITYTGTLWQLTDIGPFLAALQQCEWESTDAIDLAIAGRRTPQQDALLADLKVPQVKLTCHDYVPHQQSLLLAGQSDILLLLLADQPGAERVVPAKLFEYLALGRKILAIVPAGETQEICRRFPQVQVFSPSDTLGIARWITHQCRTCSTREAARPPNPSEQSRAETEAQLAEFSRENLTRSLANILGQSVSNVGRP